MAWVKVTYTRTIWCPYCGWDLIAPPAWTPVATCPTCCQDFSINGNAFVEGHTPLLKSEPDRGLY